MEAFKIFVTIMGVVMSLGYYPQVYKIWKNKDAANISIPTFVIFSLGTLTWLIYGIVLGDRPIVLSFSLGVVGAWAVLILAFIYKKR
jgi:MtN3 and saliva related transmembrane protein